jgi:murein DD-endopeptidase MepM/ murein hydrolase activator NlpD
MPPRKASSLSDQVGQILVVDAIRYRFPLEAADWSLYRGDAILIGADDGEPGRGGWNYARGAGHMHQGIDLRAAIGHPVVAVEDGIAEYRSADVGVAAGRWNSAGHRVRLRGRSGAGYQYFHLGISHLSIAQAFPPGISSGDVISVRAGQVLGFLGHTGGSVATRTPVPASAAHLHFQFHPLGIDLLDANPARLFELCERADSAAGHRSAGEVSVRVPASASSSASTPSGMVS